MPPYYIIIIVDTVVRQNEIQRASSMYGRSLANVHGMESENSFFLHDRIIVHQRVDVSYSLVVMYLDFDGK